jgi:hypothetical protein
MEGKCIESSTRRLNSFHEEGYWAEYPRRRMFWTLLCPGSLRFSDSLWTNRKPPASPSLEEGV